MWPVILHMKTTGPYRNDQAANSRLVERRSAVICTVESVVRFHTGRGRQRCRMPMAVVLRWLRTDHHDQ